MVLVFWVILIMLACSVLLGWSNRAAPNGPWIYYGGAFALVVVELIILGMKLFGAPH